MTAPIPPCKRPRVTVEPHPASVAGAYQTVCHVRGCSHRLFNSVKTACEEQAVLYRREHRDAVPATRIVHDVEWDVHCTPDREARAEVGGLWTPPAEVLEQLQAVA